MIETIASIIQEVVGEVLKSHDLSITYKDKDVVTSKDLEIERTLIERIQRIRPHDRFISEEENNQDLTHDSTWIIDPIDGTLNFTRQIPQFGVQVAFYENKRPVISFIYLPLEDILLHAEAGKGCFINGRPLTYETMALDQSIITFGDFSRSQPTSRPLQLALMSSIMDRVMKVRIYGASSTDFAYSIMGRTQGHIIFSRRLWELAPGLFMAKEAGLEVLEIEKDGVTGAMIGRSNILQALIQDCPLNISYHYPL